MIITELTYEQFCRIGALSHPNTFTQAQYAANGRFVRMRYYQTGVYDGVYKGDRRG